MTQGMHLIEVDSISSSAMHQNRTVKFFSCKERHQVIGLTIVNVFIQTALAEYPFASRFQYIDALVKHVQSLISFIVNHATSLHGINYN